MELGWGLVSASRETGAPRARVGRAAAASLEATFALQLRQPPWRWKLEVPWSCVVFTTPPPLALPGRRALEIGRAHV